MALPSQAARPQSARRMRYSPRRKPSWGRRIAGLVILGVVVVGVVVWGPWGGAGDGSGGGADDAPGNDTPLANANAGGERPLPIVNGTQGRDTSKPATNRTEPQTPKTTPAPNPPAHANANPANEQPATTTDPGPKETPPPPAATNSSARGTGSAYLDKLIAQGEASVERNALLEARDMFNRVLHDGRASAAQRAQLRDRLSTINQTLFFSPLVADGDPIARAYTIKSGDSLSKIAAQQDLAIEWLLLARINKIADPRRIRVDQQIKIVQGPFHAVVTKTDYRLDLYADKTDTDGNRLYIRSFPVGLGEFDLTPVGSWIVKTDSKLINPRWVNPRTGEPFAADDPENPIGERWIGLTGTDANTEIKTGYGIHGTIEPDSIGKQRSMGCVRCLPQHVEVIYEMLMPDKSQVLIVE